MGALAKKDSRCALTRRQFTKTALASAIAGILARPSWGRNPRGQPFPSIYQNPNNAMGVVVGYGACSPSTQNFAIWKNRVRECRGFTQALSINTFVALTSAGWPAADFACILNENDSSNCPAWAYGSGGVFTCGFLSPTGTETVSASDGGTVSGLVNRIAPAYTTFNLTVTSSTGAFGFKAQNTTPGSTPYNVFAYLPAYPGSAIDDPTNVNSITNEAIAHYGQFAHLRTGLGMSNAASAIYQGTAAMRATPSNFQSVQQSGVGTVALTALPGAGALNATLSAPWSQATGYYGLYFYGATANTCPLVYLKNGSTACPDPSQPNPPASGAANWITAGNLGLAQAATGNPTIAQQGLPIEWQVAVANAAKTGLWLCFPLIGDGTNFSAGSYEAAALAYVAANYTGGGNVYIEISNEVWNSGAQPYLLLRTMAQYTGFVPIGNLDSSPYVAYLLHAMANACRTAFGSAFGKTVKLVYAWQLNQISHYSEVFNYLQNNYGAPANDVQAFAVAPYMNTGFNTGTSPTAAAATVAQIEAQLTAIGSIRNFQGGVENTAIMGMHWGVPLVSYEGGWQVNSENSGETNASAAVLDSGMAAVMENYYTASYNSGFVLHSHTCAGVYDGAIPSTFLSIGDNWSNSYSAVIANTAPMELGVLPFTSGIPTPTRNTVPTHGTYAVQLTVTGSGQTNLEYGNAQNGFTIVSTGVAVNNNTVNLGNVTLVKGPNYIYLGQSASQPGITITGLQIGSAVIPANQYADALPGAANPTLSSNSQSIYGTAGYLGYLINCLA